MDVDPADLRLSAGIVDEAARDAETDLGRSVDDARDGKAGFPGTAAAAFEQAMDKFEEDLENTVKALGDLSEGLGSSANEYESADSANAVSVEQVGAPLGGSPALPPLNLPHPVTAK